MSGKMRRCFASGGEAGAELASRIIKFLFSFRFLSQYTSFLMFCYLFSARADKTPIRERGKCSIRNKSLPFFFNFLFNSPMKTKTFKGVSSETFIFLLNGFHSDRRKMFLAARRRTETRWKAFYADASLCTSMLFDNVDVRRIDKWILHKRQQ